MTDTEIAQFVAFLMVLCMAITLGVMAWWKRRRERILLGPFAIATVTSFEIASSRNGPRKQTGLRFKTPLGETVEVRHIAFSSGRVYQVGEQVHIHHDPKRPRRFMIDGDDRAYRTLQFAFMASLLVDVLILVGIGLYLAGFVEL